ncbi:hypothetical protein H6G20_07790 [Desertifilum sp. FACHB-1129]|uniref:Uncharacterized protein n=2 Tax=Desertifilum tharense IPPAS B-1220 TaxID=1781255 RepID=A0A1E5QIU6_9CYAN|nr:MULTISPECIES: hypothetical protein [Desertifilum]MDA0210557.1 hypothetical protein [Cyanobacteria bacterium FC1]MBD2311558.1 hypothetical protein [Desertifilum sp. FACHB-1129]MBD2323132.1 hypothetical protein [Desertifilum sp. FACHB-866]MBD2332977.1 hypothetical protein [Desertifilum sp. FACHB-868]OEJ74580.1 hypothetical protein BH720_14000 [Desertifilum tharense IPPAS B-1220]
MQLTWHSRWHSTIMAIAVAALCAGGIAALQIPQLNELRNAGELLTPQQAARNVERERLQLNLLQRLPTVGFDNVIANWTLINFFIYLGDDVARGYTGYQLSPEYFRIIINRDPRFVQAYLFMSSGVSLYAGRPDITIELMEKGLQYITPGIPPQSYYVWRYKAVDQLLFLGDGQGAQQSFETAAEWARLYNDEESQAVADISQETADFLAANPISTRAQINAWGLIFNTTADQKTRQIARQRILELGGDIRISPEEGVQIRYPTTD